MSDLVPLKRACKIVGVSKYAMIWATRNKRLPFYRSKNSSLWFKMDDLVHWRDTKKNHWMGRAFTHLPPPFTEEQWDALHHRVQIGWSRDGMDYASILRLPSQEIWEDE